QNKNILSDGSARQALFGWHRSKRGLQRADRSEIKIGIAPLQHPERFEAVTFQGLHQLWIERIAAPSGTERAVAGGPTSATGDLRNCGGLQLRNLMAVDFRARGECHVIDTEMEPNADGIRGHQVIDVAGLVQGDLRVTGPRRKSAQHYRRTATPAA